MVHSAYGMDVFTEKYLFGIAHLGYDSILVYVDCKEQGKQGTINFNSVIDMAEDAGLDVYFYSAFENSRHPEDKGAKGGYDALRRIVPPVFQSERSDIRWAFAPKELCTALIAHLPKDITVELNFELHDNVRIWWRLTGGETENLCSALL